MSCLPVEGLTQSLVNYLSVSSYTTSFRVLLSLMALARLVTQPVSCSALLYWPPGNASPSDLPTASLNLGNALVVNVTNLVLSMLSPLLSGETLGSGRSKPTQELAFKILTTQPFEVSSC